MSGVTWAKLFRDETLPYVARLSAGVKALNVQAPTRQQIARELSSTQNALGQRIVAEGLGLMPSPSGRDLLLTLLSSPWTEVRLSAIKALMGGGYNGAPALVQKFLLSRNSREQSEVARAFVALGDPSQYPVLEEALVSEGLSPRAARILLDGFIEDGTELAAEVVERVFRKNPSRLGIDDLRFVLSKRPESFTSALDGALHNIEQGVRSWRALRDKDLGTDEWTRRVREAAKPRGRERDFAFVLSQSHPIERGMKFFKS